jgi:hypothetical protein
VSYFEPAACSVRVEAVPVGMNRHQIPQFARPKIQNL